MKKVETVTQEIEKRFCDDCGKKGDRQCHACSKDLCWNCLLADYSKSDDYPDQYCKKCWKIGKPFFRRLIGVEKEEEKLYIKKEKIEKEWFKECKIQRAETISKGSVQ